MIRNRVLTYASLFVFALSSSPAFAVNKDLVQIESEIQDLQAAVARLQQSNDERMGVLKDLVQQTADSVNKMSLTVDTVQKQMRSQQEASGAKVDQVSGQVQSLNDSVDEVKARIGRLERALQEIQTQTQSINANIQNLNTGPAANAPAGPTTDLSQPILAPVTPPPALAPPTRKGKPSAATPMGPTSQLGPAPQTATLPVAPSVAQPSPVDTGNAPPVGDLYRTALSDYMAAKYPLASQEFTDLIRLYPQENSAGNAFYYVGEIDYREGKYAAAIKAYDAVIEQFPDSSKVPVSRLHKGMALLQIKQNDAAVLEMRTLIQRYPNSPEAASARTKLNGLGVTLTPKR